MELAGIETLQRALGATFKRDNPAFDPGRFFAAANGNPNGRDR